MDEASWGALALALTIGGGLYTALAWRARRFARAVRGAGFTLLPVAAWLTHALRMLTRISDAIGDWVVGLVFSPRVWLGVIVAGVAVVMIAAGALLERRGRSVGAAGSGRTRRLWAGREQLHASGPQLPGRPGNSGPDPELDEIEALLRKHGIS